MKTNFLLVIFSTPQREAETSEAGRGGRHTENKQTDPPQHKGVSIESVEQSVQQLFISNQLCSIYMIILISYKFTNNIHDTNTGTQDITTTSKLDSNQIFSQFRSISKWTFSPWIKMLTLKMIFSKFKFQNWKTVGFWNLENHGFQSIFKPRSITQYDF